MDFYGTYLAPLMHHAAAAVADANLGVVVDAVVARADWLRDAAHQLSNHRVLLVGVHCDLEELRRRERERGDRGAGKAEAQLAFVHPTMRELCGYDFEVNTTRTSAEECARATSTWSGCSPPRWTSLRPASPRRSNPQGHLA
jgi:chloramphenicol 3-O phosphotransferase